jgi:hypothetical protein
VHANKRAHSFVVASRRGQLTEVHAGWIPALGRSVTVHARRLRNGTFAATGMRVGRLIQRARVRGVVTFVDRADGRFVVSSRGVSMVIDRAHRARLRAAAAADSLPAPGTEVTVVGSLDNQGNVQADTVENDGQYNNYTDLEGQVLSIDTVARTLTITADDNNEIKGASILVHLPDTFDINVYHLGDVLQLVATPNPDGSYTAVGTSQDGGTQEADGQDSQQGNDQQGEQSGSPADQQGQQAGSPAGQGTQG